MLFDSHTHINNETLTEEDRIALAEKIEASDVSYVMDVGFNLESSVLAVKHAEKYPWCYAAVGCHPHDTKDMDDMQLAMLKGLAKKDKVMAIGEIGLDFHYDFSERDVQEEWFRKQIQLANELKMPITIHSREADELVMNILKEEGAFSRERMSWFPKRRGADGEMLPDARVLLHCFSGSREIGQQYIKLGGTLSIAGPITYKNARKGIEVVKNIPIEYLLVETDAPYLTPEPFRGKQNMSPYVEYTARKVAEIKEMEYEEVARITCENAKHFFGIN
ncbi:TatD family hydrolase [Aminipila luticellarii]|uniref:TatD family deoxyribonuclease n=1 Tax=Aminipila luticellarii TaxID=2507160 RepID=A0A410PXB0_9FIRM|nr:TatD family hydrolase [Aminipila luticellarii]QAT43583.1 TatD family deoxyribonuclease [Aminipila luticellarii]